MIFYKICGKVDGFCKKDNIEYIFEIKNRKNKIFTDIPIYEQIQLLIYTKILNNNNVIFVQNHRLPPARAPMLRPWESFTYKTIEILMV